jgi:hypothetical protein
MTSDEGRLSLIPLFVDWFDLPLSGYPYLGAVPWPIEMGPIVAASQRRGVPSHGDDDMLWRMVGKISLPED